MTVASPVPESLPLSALQHILFCPRQCALIHLDQEWKENKLTAEGRILHERAHEGPDESRPGIRTTRGLPVRSSALHLHGVCDIVEFHKDGTILPVEYKRGKPKAHRADEVQLCAQALCIEETMNAHIPRGYLYYGQPRRRTEVAFDSALRELVRSTAQHLQEMIASQTLPPAIYDKKKCAACSLAEICQPQTPSSASAWLRQQLKSSLETA